MLKVRTYKFDIFFKKSGFLNICHWNNPWNKNRNENRAFFSARHTHFSANSAIIIPCCLLSFSIELNIDSSLFANVFIPLSGNVCLKGQSHEMDMFLKVWNLLYVSVYALIVSNLFSPCSTSLSFFSSVQNYLLILKMLTETLLSIPLSVIGGWYLV